MTRNATNCDTWWRTPFRISSDGGKSHPLCKMHHIIPCRRAYSLYYPMGGYLVTIPSNSSSSLKVIQGGDKRATKTVQVVRLEASAEANTVALIKWNWN